LIPRILRTGRPAALIGGALLALAGCAADAPLDTLKPQGPISRSIDSLSDPIFLIAGIVFVLVFGASGLIWWKFRDDHSTDEFPPQVHGNFRLEIAWTIGPAILMAAIGVFTLFSHFELNGEDRTDIVINVDGTATSWDPEIVVIGQQWWWEFRYYFDGLDGVDLSDPRHLPPADIVTANQMVIPVGSEIGLSVTSRDVIHSFWIPALNGKRDAVPRRISPWKIEADVPGFYFGQCTEFCGLSHARMQMQTVAMTPVDFQAWVDEQMQPAAEPADAAAQRGLAVFEGQCTRCHVVNGINGAIDDQPSKGADLVANAAPNLTHLMSRTTFAGGIFDLYEPDGSLNRTQLEAWLRNAPAEKPAYAEGRRGMPALGLGEGQIDDVVAYLQTLGAKPDMEIIAATEVHP
jgi:cytochrome c oxidase subunit 2|tara:strand:+ start:5478 stop:6692 length:1215 start_codon:yes stop_codon:yes gene_type:complete